MKEHFFQCPYCWETISMLIDTSVRQQNYIEDCEVCCRPIQINVHCIEDDISSFVAEAIQ